MAQQTKENLPTSSAKLQGIIAHQRGDPELAEVRSYCQKGWPAFMPQNPLLHQYSKDLFDLHGKTYLLVVDYHSRWPEIRLLDRLTSAAVIIRLKSTFATHGIPDLVVFDNGPQFASAEFRQFSSIFGFTHTTSSPRHPQANGEAEHAVKTVKNLLRKAADPYRDSQGKAYNRRHAARQAPELHPGDSVYIKDLGRPGSVAAQHHNPRSYIILTDQGTVRRNRSHLVATDASGQPQSDSMTPKTPTPVPRAVSPAASGSTPAFEEPTGGAPSSPGPQVTRSGRAVIPPKKVDIILDCYRQPILGYNTPSTFILLVPVLQ
ncbi:Pol polyprotein [Elysia marginata]|uniref:Pol polyprotein n=1 Tax=Elysia marginata TaxID=1093978 RepID=A0AAV4JHV9_9GAST|nr:Pol polyprotein [Elysia marginata]